MKENFEKKKEREEQKFYYSTTCNECYELKIY